MISEFFLRIFLAIPMLVLRQLPVISFASFESGVYSSIISFLNFAAYFLPMGTISAILMILIAEELFKIGIAFLKMLLNFIPFF